MCDLSPQFLVGRVAIVSRGPLLRNCCFNELTCREIDQTKSEMIGALTEATEDMRTVLCVIHVGTKIGVHQMVFQGSIDEDRELPRRGGDSLGFPDAEGHASIECAEGGLAARQRHRGESQDRGGAIGRRLRAAAQETAA